MALTGSKGLPVGTSAPPFALPGVDGATHRLEDFADARALVVIFTCNHCPYAVALEDRFIALQEETRVAGVRLVAISANDARNYPADSFEAMKARSEAKGFNFPYLYDESQAVARAYDAACTPDPFVFDASRKLVYNGRVDDSWRDASRVTRRDLRAAIDHALAGTALDFEAQPALGCSIKWK
ncbi:MAG: thioredoxin family protein [Myxococcota bacterium]